MKKGLLKQFPKQIREKILDHTIESYELRDVILKLIEKKPKIHNQNLFKRRRTSGFARRKRF